MTEELEQLLENLKLRATAARFEELLAAAESAGTPTVTFVTQLLRAEWESRQEETLRRRIRRASFPEEWTLESFPFKLQTGIKERRSAPLPSSTSSPRPRISCLSAKQASARPG